MRPGYLRVGGFTGHGNRLSLDAVDVMRRLALYKGGAV
jgi:hypothetical protein